MYNKALHKDLVHLAPFSRRFAGKKVAKCTKPMNATLGPIRKTSMSPTFPAIWLGDTCGLMHHQDEKAFFTAQLMIWGPLTFEFGTIIDLNGEEWSITVSEKEKVPVINRIKVFLGIYIETTVTYDYKKLNRLGLEELKARLAKQSENDPGDIMWHFIEHENIVSGVMNAKSYQELFAFINSKICSENHA